MSVSVELPARGDREAGAEAEAAPATVAEADAPPGTGADAGAAPALAPAEAEPAPPRPTAARRIEAPSPSALPADAGLRLDGLTPAGGLRACLACGHPELYTRKDFPRALGVAIVVVAAVLAPFTWYLSLVAAALADAVLYRLAPEVVVCYVCAAEHRGFPRPPRHPRFDIEIEERLRYGDRAVMGKPMRPDGTADAPDPEH